MTKRGTSKLTIETISPYFTQNIQTASKELGICCTLLKKVCRKYGITRWPYRKIQSVDKTIQQIKERITFLESQLARDSTGSIHLELEKLRRESLELERKKQALLRPDKALINPYNLQPNYRLPFYWGADRMLPQVASRKMTDQLELRREDFATSWEFPIVDSSPSCSEQTLETSVPSAETLRCTQRDNNETFTSRGPMHKMPLERDVGYSESFPSEKSFPFIYPNKRENESFSVNNDESFSIPKNDQFSLCSVSQTQRDSSFEETSLHNFLSSPNNQLDHLLAENTFRDVGTDRWKRGRFDSPFDYASSSWQVLGRQRSASSISGGVVAGGGKRGDEFSVDSRRRLSLAEEMMVGRVSDMEVFSQDEYIPSSHVVNDTASNRESENDIHNTLFGLFQRMDQLEQENSRLRNNLNHLVARIPNPNIKEQLY